MYVGNFVSYTLTTNEIPYRIMSQVIFLTDQSSTNLLHLEILKPNPTLQVLYNQSIQLTVLYDLLVKDERRLSYIIPNGKLLLHVNVNKREKNNNNKKPNKKNQKETEKRERKKNKSKQTNNRTALNGQFERCVSTRQLVK